MRESSNIPDFIVIGAMKAGTTSLYYYLNSHPDIFMALPKEPRYFSLENIFKKGDEWYLSLFKKATVNQFTGEASTCYTRWPTFSNVPDRIFKVNPQVKLIYILRNPVDRAYSHYRHLALIDNKKYASFEEAIENEREIIDASKYMMQINRFLKVFPKDQLLLVDFNEFKNAPNEVLNKIQKFIGCNAVSLVRGEGLIKNNFKSSIDKTTKKRLIKNIRLLMNLSGIKFLIDAIFSKKSKANILNKITSCYLLFSRRFIENKYKRKIEPLTNRMRDQLLVEFREDIDELELYCGKSFDRWYS